VTEEYNKTCFTKKVVALKFVYYTNFVILSLKVSVEASNADSFFITNDIGLLIMSCC